MLAIADLKIDDNGELLLIKQDVDSYRQKVKFYIGNNNSQRIRFHIEAQKSEKREYGLKLSFLIRQSEKNKFVDIVKGIDANEQYIKSLLRTPKNSLPNRIFFGSSLTEHKHTKVDDTSINNLEIKIEKELQEFIIKPKIKIVPYINKANSYKQGIKVVVDGTDNFHVEHLQ